MSIGNQSYDFIDFDFVELHSRFLRDRRFFVYPNPASWRIRWIRTQSTQSQKHMDQFFAIFAQTFATFVVNGFQLFQQPQQNILSPPWGNKKGGFKLNDQCFFSTEILKHYTAGGLR